MIYLLDCRQRLSDWDKLDLQPHELCHNLVKVLHISCSYVTGHLPREHPHVVDTTHNDRDEEGVFLGNVLLLISGCIVFVMGR